jgi:hypothetical protein
MSTTKLHLQFSDQVSKIHDSQVLCKLMFLYIIRNDRFHLNETFECVRTEATKGKLTRRHRSNKYMRKYGDAVPMQNFHGRHL